MDYAMLLGGEDDDGSIRKWVSDESIDAVTVVDEAEDWIYARLRDWRMLAIDTSLTMSADSNTLTKPTDFLAPHTFNITGTNKARLKLRTPAYIENNWQYDSSGTLITGKPDSYYVRGSTIVLNKSADAAYTTQLLYYQRPTALSNSNTSNFLTNEFSRLMRLVCCAFASEFQVNEKMRDWYFGRALEELAERKIQSDIDFPYDDVLLDTDHRS